MTTLEDKILGCMVGGAVGDALGYTIEFMNYNQIVRKYGPAGITRYELNRDGIAEISDDTQMSLYTANGLLIGDKDDQLPAAITAAYLEWLDTQSYLGKPKENAKCWISKMPEMYSLRAPGNTCLSALRSIKEGRVAQNCSKGCGGIMRVAPVGIFGAVNHWPVAKTAEVACEAARLTHKHPLGWIPAGVFAVLIHTFLEMDQAKKDDYFGDPINLCVALAIGEQMVKKYIAASGNKDDLEDEFREFSQGAMHAISLACEDLPDEEAIRQIGEGWTCEEAYYIALYCMLKHLDSFEDAVVAAVNHSGDSDSTGAITGNLMGAIHGYDAIPEYYKTNLELREAIETMARDLCAGKSSR